MCIMCDSISRSKKAWKKFLNLSKSKLKKSFLLADTDGELFSKCRQVDGIYYSYVYTGHVDQGEGKSHPLLDLSIEEINGEYEGVMRDAFGEEEGEKVKVTLIVTEDRRKKKMMGDPCLKFKMEVKGSETKTREYKIKMFVSLLDEVEGQRLLDKGMNQMVCGEGEIIKKGTSPKDVLGRIW
jgi:uncharacterized C2H2 Zn-finger protein